MSHLYHPFPLLLRVVLLLLLLLQFYYNHNTTINNIESLIFPGNLTLDNPKKRKSAKQKLDQAPKAFPMIVTANNFKCENYDRRTGGIKTEQETPRLNQNGSETEQSQIEDFSGNKRKKTKRRKEN